MFVAVIVFLSFCEKTASACFGRILLRFFWAEFCFSLFWQNPASVCCANPASAGADQLVFFFWLSVGFAFFASKVTFLRLVLFTAVALQELLAFFVHAVESAGQAAACSEHVWAAWHAAACSGQDLDCWHAAACSGHVWAAWHAAACSEHVWGAWQGVAFVQAAASLQVGA